MAFFCSATVFHTIKMGFYSFSLRALHKKWTQLIFRVLWETKHDYPFNDNKMIVIKNPQGMPVLDACLILALLTRRGQVTQTYVSI